MIKNFFSFINENFDEDDIFSLNKEEKNNYFLQRIEEFKINTQFSFEDYEWDLCPPKIKKVYINLCAYKGDGLTDYMFANIKDNYTKTLYIINSNLESYELPDNLFSRLSEELKRFYIDKKINTTIHKIPNSYQSELSDEEFEWCNDSLKEKYIKRLLKSSIPDYIDYISFDNFKWCSDNLRIKYINKLMDNNISINSDKFEICSDRIKKYYVDKLFEANDDFDDRLFNLCSDKLKLYFINVAKQTINFYLTPNQLNYKK